jgi:hypothetical protein
VENRALCEITCKNAVQPDRSQMTIWRMRNACWISKPTNTHSESVERITFPLQQWLYESASVLHYTYIACLVSVRIDLPVEAPTLLSKTIIPLQ